MYLFGFYGLMYKSMLSQLLTNMLCPRSMSAETEEKTSPEIMLASLEGS